MKSAAGFFSRAAGVGSDVAAAGGGGGGGDVLREKSSSSPSRHRLSSPAPTVNDTQPVIYTNVHIIDVKLGRRR